MNPTRARRLIRELTRQGCVVITAYCALRMLQRSVSREEVLAVLLHARACQAQENGRWKIEGANEEGGPLIAIVQIQKNAIVVTVYRGDDDED